VSTESKQIFKTQLEFKKQQSKRKLKTRKQSAWITPTAYYRQMRKIIKIVMDKYTNLTLSLFPLLDDWNKEVKQIDDHKDAINATLKYITNPIEKEIKFNSLLKYRIKHDHLDQWEEELNNINETEYENLFNEEKDSTKRLLLTTGALISAFNLKQWQKVTKQGVGIDTFAFENWENSFLNTWVNRNVGLIKGLTEEYRKKINDTIIDSFQRGVRLEELKANLRKINKTFSESRVNLIARDQTNKLNAQLSQQRQKDAGVDTYYFMTSLDERVRKPKHSFMHGKLCRWDDPTVYSPDNGKTWISRGVGVMLHPGEDYYCRCFAEPNFEPLVNEVNKE
jgi:SPP1 gp7 family putative phage head morphogenesis protein